MKRYTVTVLYKGGATMTFKCDSCTAHREGGRLTRVEWVNPSPKPLHFGVDEVAAIWSDRGILA